jgi:hypothetical protein
VSKGVPYDVALSLSEMDLMAYSVALGELSGGVFDWQSLSWREPE